MPLHRFWFALFVAGLCCATLLSTGCSSPVTVQRWQRGVGEYIQTTANNDITELRNLEDHGGRKALGIISENDPQNSSDVVGLLVAHKKIGGESWAVFLVGVVNHMNLTELRLAAVSVRNSGLFWQLDDPDRAALAQYKKHNPASSAGRTEPGWPHDADSFEVQVVGQTVRVTEKHCDAHWNLTLASPAELSRRQPTADTARASATPETNTK
jgi:hypothetical protein